MRDETQRWLFPNSSIAGFLKPKEQPTATTPRLDRSALAASLILALFGCALFVAQQSIGVFEDEASIVALAGMQTPGEIVNAFLHGAGQHKHPPLYDLFLNGWMSITDDARTLLRLPSVIFYCLALWFIGATAQLLWGKRLP